MNKKGQGISMTYIIVAALALVVLVVIVLFFTGGIKTLTSGQRGLVQGAVPDWQMKLWTDRCQQSCDLENKEDFCKTLFTADTNDDGTVDTAYMCTSGQYDKLSENNQAKIKEWKPGQKKDLGISCSAITC